MTTKLKKKLLYTKLLTVVVNVSYLLEGIVIRRIVGWPVLIYSTPLFFIGLVIYSIVIIKDYPNNDKEINKPVAMFKQLLFLTVLFIPSFLWGVVLYLISTLPVF